MSNASPQTVTPSGSLDDKRQDVQVLLSNTRQLTFAGRRAGEGYFSQDGKMMVFQSEREPGNPFFQIYLMSLATGDIRRISPGYGKTTCAWIHPDNQRVLFASTHLDPDSRKSACGKPRDILIIKMLEQLFEEVV